MAREKWGARFSIVVVAEGAMPEGRQAAPDPGSARRQRRAARRRRRPRCRRSSAELTGKETRSVVLGHLQRGGAPTSFDRVAGHALRRQGRAAADRRRRSTRWWRSTRRPSSACRSTSIVGRTKNVPLDSDLVATARALGVSFGDDVECSYAALGDGRAGASRAGSRRLREDRLAARRARAMQASATISFIRALRPFSRPAKITPSWARSCPPPS